MNEWKEIAKEPIPLTDGDSPKILLIGNQGAVLPVFNFDGLIMDVAGNQISLNNVTHWMLPEPPK